MTLPSWKNKLYFGDNLDILREHIRDESVDLIYLDPAFSAMCFTKHRSNSDVIQYKTGRPAQN